MSKKPKVVRVRISEQEHFNNAGDGVRLLLLRKQLLRVEKGLRVLLRKRKAPRAS